MELRKKNEHVSRIYGEDGVMTEKVDSAEFDVLDDNGTRIGNATCREYNVDVNLSLPASSFKEAEQKTKAIFGIEEGGEA